MPFALALLGSCRSLTSYADDLLAMLQRKRDHAAFSKGTSRFQSPVSSAGIIPRSGRLWSSLECWNCQAVPVIDAAASLAKNAASARSSSTVATRLAAAARVLWVETR
jgi:hypothetical protein